MISSIPIASGTRSEHLKYDVWMQYKRKKWLFFCNSYLDVVLLRPLKEKEKNYFRGCFREKGIFLFPIASGTGRDRNTRNHKNLCQGSRNSGSKLRIIVPLVGEENNITWSKNSPFKLNAMREYVLRELVYQLKSYLRMAKFYFSNFCFFYPRKFPAANDYYSNNYAYYQYFFFFTFMIYVKL